MNSLKQKPTKSKPATITPAQPPPLFLSGSDAVDELRIVSDYLLVIYLAVRGLSDTDSAQVESLCSLVHQTARHLEEVREHLSAKAVA